MNQIAKVQQSKQVAQNFLSIHDLKFASKSRFAIWVFDLDNFCIVWANAQALTLWRAETLDELYFRNMRDDLSISAENRLKQFQIDFFAEKTFDEVWTIFPKGEPRQINSRFRGVVLDDGRMAMLCEADAPEQESAEVARSSQALLYTSAMVSIYSDDGQCIYANPTARQSFSTDCTSVSDRFCSKRTADNLSNFSNGLLEGKFTAPVRTVSGERIHEVDARISYDAASGKKTLLLTEIDITEQEKTKQTLAHAATHDALTGLKNRNGFLEAFEAFSDECRAANKSFAVYFLDIDRFKNVNDTMGHHAGDDLLVAVAEKLKDFLGKDCVIARFGGDEFTILVPYDVSIESEASIGKSILSAFKDPVQIQKKDWRISVSVGFSKPDHSDGSIDSLLQKADLALYQAKKCGGGQVAAFDPRLAIKQNRFVEIESELRDSLKDNGFDMLFQPIVDLETDAIVGAEALLRLKRDDRLWCQPAEFIPIAEATGLIDEIGIWVLNHAAHGLIELHKKHKNIYISVNLSPQQFSNPLLLKTLREICHLPNFEPSMLKLEITESILAPNNKALRKMMKEISALGFSFSIDDFGTAFSNLAALHRYPISCIKIDKSLTHADNFKALVRGALTISRELGISTIAEGVETVAQREWLKENDCDQYQGFLAHRPMEFSKFLSVCA